MKMKVSLCKCKASGFAPLAYFFEEGGFFDDQKRARARASHIPCGIDSAGGCGNLKSLYENYIQVDTKWNFAVSKNR